jgi:hypothetical protein
LGLRFLAALPAAVLLTSCGYIGDPLPPLANIPAGIADLAAIQRGTRIVAHFTIPTRTTEGFPVPHPLTLDLRIGTAEHYQANEWAARARHIPAPAITGPLATYEIPAAEWTGKEVALAVRVTAGNGKQTGWSNLIVLPVIPAPPKPDAVTPTATAQGVHLTWHASGKDFRVLRKSDAGEYVQVAEVPAAEWTDTATEFGKRYAYVVQTVVKLDGNKQAESDLSDEVSISPEDKFPPAVPAGLRADTAPASIELAWDRNTEPDLAGYRIYRATDTGPLDKLADTSQVPTYSDRAVDHGKTYRYAVTAIDRNGNESPRSALVEAAFR